MRLKDSDQTIRQLVDDQLLAAEKSMEYVYSNATGLINSNRLLVDELQKDKREKPQLEHTYRPLAEGLNDVLEQTISFMYTNIHEFDFPEDALKKKQHLFSPKKELTPKPQPSVVSQIVQLTEAKSKGFFGKHMTKGSAFKQRHLFMMATNMR